MLDAEMQVVAESPDPGRLFVYEPALVKLPSGRLLVTFEHTRIDANAEVPHRFRLAVSEDSGRTWRQLPPLDLHSAQPFVHKSELYLLGNVAIRRNIVILRSGDEGRSWTRPVTLFEGKLLERAHRSLDQGRASLPVLQPARERRRHAKSAELPGVRGHRWEPLPESPGPGRLENVQPSGLPGDPAAVDPRAGRREDARTTGWNPICWR